MTLAVLGGSFDPVHIGHLVLAQEVREQLGVDRVLLVPTFLSPHKEPDSGPGHAEPEDRLEMLRRSVAGLPGLQVDDVEIRRGGVSYTVVTLQHIIEAYAPLERPLLVVGDDLLEGFRRWREPERVAALARIVVAHRTSFERKPFDYPHQYLANRVLEVTSTQMRQRIREGRPVDLLVPAGALEHIRARGLYGCARSET